MPRFRGGGSSTGGVVAGSITSSPGFATTESGGGGKSRIVELSVANRHKNSLIPERRASFLPARSAGDRFPFRIPFEANHIVVFALIGFVSAFDEQHAGTDEESE